MLHFLVDTQSKAGSQSSALSELSELSHKQPLVSPPKKNSSGVLPESVEEVGREAKQVLSGSSGGPKKVGNPELEELSRMNPLVAKGSFGNSSIEEIAATVRLMSQQFQENAEPHDPKRPTGAGQHGVGEERTLCLGWPKGPELLDAGACF